MKDNKSLDKKIEYGYIQDGDASRYHFLHNKKAMPTEWADIVVPFFEQLITEARIEELEKTMPHTDGMRHYNTVNARLKTLKDELAKLKLIGNVDE